MSMYKLVMTNSVPTRFKNNGYKSNARFYLKNKTKQKIWVCIPFSKVLLYICFSYTQKHTHICTGCDISSCVSCGL